MRPTGKLHLGHLVGALQNWTHLQDVYDCFYFVADWHALTSHYADTGEIVGNALDNVADWIGAGLDPERSVFFVQSLVPEHAELYLLLQMVTPIPWLERVPTYKEQIEQLREKELNTYGFLGYPLLQSADILVYRADFVPVGEDQKPHVELTREIARRFNNFYGNVLTEPDVKLTRTPKLPGTDGRKMSKSYGNTIGLAEDEASVRGKLKTMMTDPARKRRTDPGDPAKCPVFDLHKVFSTEKTRAWASEGCRTAGIGCIECKSALADHLVSHLEPIAKRRHEYERRPDDVRDIFVAGAGRAGEVAESTMADVREAVKLPPMGSL